MILVFIVFILLEVFSQGVTKEYVVKGIIKGTKTFDMGANSDKLCFLTSLGMVYDTSEYCSVDPNYEGGLSVWNLNAKSAQAGFGCGSRCYSFQNMSVEFSLSSLLDGEGTSAISLGPVEDRFCYLTRVHALQTTSNCQVTTWFNDGRDPAPMGDYWVLQKTGNTGGFECKARCVIAKKESWRNSQDPAFKFSDEIAVSNKGATNTWLWEVSSSFCYISQAQFIYTTGDYCTIDQATNPSTQQATWRLNATSVEVDFRCGARCVQFF